MKKFNALVIDDDEGICEEITSRLSIFEHTCCCVNTVTDARSALQDNCFDYIILDMEIPNVFGSTPSITIGENFLKYLRSKFPENLPIIVITGLAASHIDLGSNVIFNGATDFILKPLQTSGEHTLESSIQKFVGFVNKKRLTTPDDAWLTRTIQGNQVTWHTTARNGQVREYVVDITSKRCRVLDCILVLYRKNSFISNQDIMDRVGWKYKQFFASNGGAARGPLKNHATELRKMLGIGISFVEHGINVIRPEN